VRGGGSYNSVFLRRSFLNLTVKKIWKLIHVCRRYHKNKSGTYVFFETRCTVQLEQYDMHSAITCKLEITYVRFNSSPISFTRLLSAWSIACGKHWSYFWENLHFPHRFHPGPAGCFSPGRFGLESADALANTFMHIAQWETYTVVNEEFTVSSSTLFSCSEVINRDLYRFFSILYSLWFVLWDEQVSLFAVC